MLRKYSVLIPLLLFLVACSNQDHGQDRSKAVPIAPADRSATDTGGKDVMERQKVIYDELSQECAKYPANQAEALRALGIQPNKSILKNHYTSHYNGRLNKCLAVREFILDMGDSTVAHSKTLIDVSEGGELGEFVADAGELMHCGVLSKSCNSELEWDALVRPYMEE